MTMKVSSLPSSEEAASEGRHRGGGRWWAVVVVFVPEGLMMPESLPHPVGCISLIMNYSGFTLQSLFGKVSGKRLELLVSTDGGSMYPGKHCVSL